MENKINIAEILKDCPKGMELYSPIFGEVYLDKIRPHLAIVVTTDKEQGDFKEEFFYDGRYGMDGECMIFPSKDQRDWSKFQRPFKIGDKIVHKAYKESPFTITEITDTSYKGGDRYEVLIEQQDNFELAPSKFDISILKPFDKVLVRDDNERCWNCELFDSYRRDMHYQFNGIAACYKQCIPYEGNEHLLGTINNCDDFYKTWE